MCSKIVSQSQGSSRASTPSVQAELRWFDPSKSCLVLKEGLCNAADRGEAPGARFYHVKLSVD